LGALTDVVQHHKHCRQVIVDAGKTQALGAAGNHRRTGVGIARGKQRDVMTLAHEFFSQP
jgi:hypothetical protein